MHAFAYHIAVAMSSIYILSLMVPAEQQNGLLLEPGIMPAEK